MMKLDHFQANHGLEMNMGLVLRQESLKPLRDITITEQVKEGKR